MVAREQALQRQQESDEPESDMESGILGLIRNFTAKPDADPLDQLIHERMRLGIVSALAACESMTFGDLKNLLNTTDGNLSVHARKLEEAEYITCTKSFEGRKPKTRYGLTEKGRRALERYLEHMEALIQAMRDL